MSVEEQLKVLPHHPGVYLMKNSAGHIIYVGKAVSLRNRVRSYFQNSRNHTPKTEVMVAQVSSIDYILVDSEVEALILENNLIKEHSPKYNIRLRDDKTFPYIKVTASEDFPRVYATRKVVKDGARYYGPYTDVDAMHETIRLLKDIFPLRDCRKPIKAVPGGRPCLNYHIGRCSGPCAGHVSRDDYRQMVRKVELFLEGKQESITKDLKAEMEAAAEGMEFERAAELRDTIGSVEKVIEKQKIVSMSDDDSDVVALARNDSLACVQVLLIRGGKMVGREHFYLEVSDVNADSEVLSAFLARFYDDLPHVPKEIIMQLEVPDQAIVEEWLSARRGTKVSLHTPKRGDKLRLVEMGERNAQMLLQQADMKRDIEETRAQTALQTIAEYLGLPDLPMRIEAYDISNTQGNQTVASMVVFEGGKPKKSDYRRFTIRTVEGPNDFASMAEVIGRRFRRALAGGQTAEDAADSPGVEDKFGALPDLVLIDGGKGQLSSAREVMEGLGFSHISTVGLAKEFEYLYQPGQSDPVILPRDSEALYLVQRIRDEAHRFAITFHRSLRAKVMVKSILDEVPGIGKKRRLALLQAFGSVDKMRGASVEDLAAVTGMNRDVAEKVQEHLRVIARE